MKTMSLWKKQQQQKILMRQNRLKKLYKQKVRVISNVIFPTVVCVLLEIDVLIFEKSSNEGKTFLVLRSTSLAINPHSLEI